MEHAKFNEDEEKTHGTCQFAAHEADDVEQWPVSHYRVYQFMEHTKRSHQERWNNTTASILAPFCSFVFISAFYFPKLSTRTTTRSHSISPGSTSKCKCQPITNQRSAGKSSSVAWGRGFRVQSPTQRKQQQRATNKLIVLFSLSADPFTRR